MENFADPPSDIFIFSRTPPHIFYFVQSDVINIIFLCQVCNSRQVRNSHQVA